MSEVDADQLKQAVEGQHGARLCWRLSSPSKRSSTASRSGVVHVFDLEGHPNATRAYAWSSPVEGCNRRRFYAVLHLGGIRSPLDAVQAAIVAETKRR
jgi:hypothetical protein